MNNESNIIALNTKAGQRAKSKSRLLAGAMALGVTGALIAPLTFAPAPVLAEPVRVEAPAMANFAPVVEAVQPAVVSVRVRSEIQPSSMSGSIPPMFRDIPEDHPLKRFFDGFGSQGGNGEGEQRKAPKRYGQSQGSGFFISSDGYVVTNEHVVGDGTEFTIITQDGEEYDATLVGADERSDLALLKVDSDKDFTYVDFAEDAPMVGEWVVAVGNPFGLGGTVTAGIVSARGRDIGAGLYDDFIQIDASVNRGNSGGPAFNIRGEVIGVNSAIISPSGGNVGIAFAIPAATTKKIIEDLKEDGTVTRGWLGVQIQPVTEDIAESLGLESKDGTLIAEAQKDTPAQEAGLKSGDIILEVDGKAIKGPRELAKTIAGYSPNTTVEVKFWRDGEVETVDVKLGNIPEEQKAASAEKKSGKATGTALVESLGIELATASSQGIESDGVVVMSVEPDSPAAEKGLRKGSIITQVASKNVTTPEEVAEQVESAKEQGRKAVLLRVENNGNTMFVAIPFEEA
ncbi:Do family serine endopeptidase [Rhodobacteraceae bacterium RKSG542]|uniref:Do family serine endopeptidase n=1 Tax=Pseudovibrio flavus TaxID=2529854 RepID=UPI0012BD67D5|nr:Do family serine endopeptidase [Pseudovibrio flavus]MTI17040.1 Do family serine endopeptidase [Pseudovibrio flavus]